MIELSFVSLCAAGDLFMRRFAKVTWRPLSIASIDMTRRRQRLECDDTVAFKAAVGGKRITIIVDREAVEDCLRRVSTTHEDRMSFMLQNRQRLVASVERYIEHVEDGEGIMLPASHILQGED